jgi:hypothetical protein
MGPREASADAARVGAAEAEGRCAGEAARVRAREGEESKVTRAKAMERAWKIMMDVQQGDGFWDRLWSAIADALLATERDTAKRCAEIAREHDALGSGSDAIRREFELGATR